MEFREIFRIFFWILELGILCTLFIEVKKIKNVIEEEDFEILKDKSLKFSSKMIWLSIIGTIFGMIAILLD